MTEIINIPAYTLTTCVHRCNVRVWCMIHVVRKKFILQSKSASSVRAMLVTGAMNAYPSGRDAT